MAECTDCEPGEQAGLQILDVSADVTRQLMEFGHGGSGGFTTFLHAGPHTLQLTVHVLLHQWVSKKWPGIL